MTLLHGDCLDIMKTIPDKSIDLVLTDPPYGTSHCKWDTVIPFDLMWKELQRISNAFLLFGSEPFSSALRMSNIKNYRFDWIWQKEQGIDFQLANKRPMKSHELISAFGTLKYFPQGLKLKNQFREANNHINKNRISSEGVRRINPKTTKPHESKFSNYPVQIVRFPKNRDNLHPTQKPLGILEYLIKTHSMEDDTVLDFTMGSGSTGVACKNLNRKFIGIEKDEKYYQIACERLGSREGTSK